MKLAHVRYSKKDTAKDDVPPIEVTTTHESRVKTKGLLLIVFTTLTWNKFLFEIKKSSGDAAALKALK